ncbi:MAG: hypothetical protein ACOCWM_05910, partial [Cyclobacteriaceae bacterium]
SGKLVNQKTARHIHGALATIKKDSPIMNLKHILIIMISLFSSCKGQDRNIPEWANFFNKKEYIQLFYRYCRRIF